MEVVGIVLIGLILMSALLIFPIAAIIHLYSIRREQEETRHTLAALSEAVERLRAMVREAVSGEEPQAPPPVQPAVPAAPSRPPVTGEAPTASTEGTAPPPLPPAVLPPAPVPDRPMPAHATPPPLPPPAAEEAFAPADVETPAPPAWVERTRDVLRKIWNWLLVNQEFRPEGVTAEYAIASTWLLRVGILAMVGAPAFFLMWSIEEGLMPAVVRVAISIFAGLAMLVAGVRLMRGKYGLIGQGLLGGGLLVLYFSMYATGPMYRLIPMLWVFGLMILVTAAAGALAVRLNSLLAAVIGIAGAYATPLVIRTGTVNLPGLFSYILLISLGILTVAYFRQWRLLNYLGFIGTYLLFILAVHSGYDRVRDFAITISFLSAFFVIHSAIVYIHNIAKGDRSTLLELMHLVLNALVFAGWGFYLIRDAHGRPYPALMSLSLAVFYVLHVFVFLHKRLNDRPLLITLIALAGLFTTWTLPLVFEKETLTIGLSLLALMFLWLGQRLDCRFLESLAQLLYLVVFFRLAVWELPEQFGRHHAAADPMTLYWADMRHRLLSFGVSIASVAAAFFLQRRRLEASPRFAVERANDIPAGLPQGMATGMFYWFAVGFTFLFLNLEVYTMFGFAEWAPFRPPALTVLWCLLAAFFLWRYLAAGRRDGTAFWAMGLVAALAFGKVLCVDLAAWDFDEGLLYGIAYTPEHVASRLLDFVAAIAFFLLAWRWTSEDPGGRAGTAAFGYAALILLFLYSTFELNTFLHVRKPDFQRAGLSILWALFAAGFVTGGIWKTIRGLRYTGLVLFAVVAVKVAFHDLATMPMIYRVVALGVLGGALVLGAFAYIHSSRKFVRAAPPAPADPGEQPKEPNT